MAVGQHESEIKVTPARSILRNEDMALMQDERWLLVQRILASAGFQRADQLRKILLYTTRQAILRPDEPIREYEIACTVLGRRPDFDSGTDNIVRVQISHLRRKLEHYYSTEGAREHILLTIPRGSHAACFEPTPLSLPSLRPLPETGIAAPVELNAAPHTEPAVELSPTLATASAWSNREILLLALLCVAAILASASFLTRPKAAPSAITTGANATNPFLLPLVKNHKSISVILPDTSLMVIQSTLGEDSTIDDYLTDFPQHQLKNVTDPALRDAFIYLASKRNTSFGESSIAMNLSDQMSHLGSTVKLVYARDLHVRDLGENNLVILGSRSSNPWASLFTEKTNFRYVPERGTHNFAFINARPKPGEQALYVSDQSRKDRQISYVDIALLPNLTNSGYVLMINGTDVQATEAAERFMVGESWPSEIKKLFSDKDLRRYEVFLRGQHIAGEADDDLEVIAVRSDK